MSNKTVIELEIGDCAIVFRGEEFEAYITKPNDENEVVSDSVAICCALNIRLGDPEFAQEQIDWLNGVIDDLESGKEE